MEYMSTEYLFGAVWAAWFVVIDYSGNGDQHFELLLLLESTIP